MASDNEYDIFDFNSSQHFSSIECQIDRFEFHHYVKSNKNKRKKSSYLKSRNARQSHSVPVKDNYINSQTTPKSDRQPFHYRQRSKGFQCDKKFHIRTIPSKEQIDTQSNAGSNRSETLKTKHLKNFSNFRRHFYQVKHQSIKSSFTTLSNIEIIDIRVALINPYVQNDFMQRLRQNPLNFPQLVYHGTELSNISSILHYGFLIPNQPHPTNIEAPIIVSKHGQSYGKGIYCSQTANYSLSYMNSTNTLLACAAIPHRNECGQLEGCHKNIIVLPHVSQIIPLFLVDFKYLNSSQANCHWFKRRKK